jgi:hypothetical protein
MTTPSLPPTPPADPGQPASGPVYPPAGAAYQPPVVEPYVTPTIQPVTASAPRRSNAGGYLLTIAAVIAVGGLAFALGRVTAPASASTGAVAARGFANGGFANGGFAPGGSFTPGDGGGGFGRRALTTEATVTAVAPDHLTIQIGTNGQTIDVATDSSTTYHTQQPATASAVTAGSKVILQFNPPTSTANGSGSNGTGQAPSASGAPGGGFARVFGTVKDVTVVGQ